MTRCTRLLPGLVAIATLLGSAPAFAQPKSGGSAAAAEPLTEDQIKAQQHFKAAKDLYAAGSYREAAAELEAARALDPKAKDLVFNLGIVHEKLGKFDEAIGYFRTYLEMEGVTAQEKQKAESIIKRIEGAKREVATPTPSGSQTSNGSGTQSPPPHPPPGGEERPQGHGRIDAATIAAASVAVVVLGVGTGFGIYALTTRPTNFVTGRDGTYQDLKDKTDQAHTAALVSDVGFGVGIVAAAVTAWLYFGRPKEPQRTGVTVTPAMLPGGGAFLVGGSFR